MKKISPAEIEAAHRLALWVDGETKHFVENDVLEAIYVLSPERCPDPKSTLNDVLSRISAGPFGDGEEPEETVDDENYLRALMQNEAPSPKLSLDDVLARVQSGPFAENNQEDEIIDNIVPLRPWWQRTEVALLAAAAVALLILVPSTFRSAEEADLFSQPAKQSMEQEEALERISNSRPTERTEKREKQASVPSSSPEEVLEEEMEPALVPRPKKKRAEVASVKTRKIKPASKSTEVPLRADEESPPIPAPQKEETPPLKEAEAIVVADAELAEDDGVNADTEDLTKEIAAPAVRSQDVERKRRRVRDVLSSNGRTSGAKMASPPESAKPVLSSAESDSAAELLSTKEKQEIAQIGSPEELLRYAERFQDSKALAVLWQGIAGRENAFAIDALLYSSRFRAGEARYLRRNYQLLITLLLQEGRMAEAQGYQDELDALE